MKRHKNFQNSPPDNEKSQSNRKSSASLTGWVGGMQPSVAVARPRNIPPCSPQMGSEHPPQYRITSVHKGKSRQCPFIVPLRTCSGPICSLQRIRSTLLARRSRTNN
jgi:hypothetical protein